MVASIIIYQVLMVAIYPSLPLLYYHANIIIKVIENLSRGGASIQQINTVRKAISQTKGGKLAEAAFPAQVGIVKAKLPKYQGGKRNNYFVQCR